MSSWQSIDKCKSCGSSNIDKDHEQEIWNCNDCGSGGGGVDFWQ